MYFTLCLSTEWFLLTDPSTITFIKYHPFQNAGKTNIYCGEHYLHLGSYKQHACPKTNHVGKEEFEVLWSKKGRGFSGS